jgi:hypothetical protein
LQPAEANGPSANEAGRGHDPARWYSERLASHRTRVNRLQRLHVRLAWIRVAAIVLTVAVSYQACNSRTVSAAWIGLGVAVIVALAVVLARLEAAMASGTAAIRYCENGLARVEERWMEGGETGLAYIEENHPYSVDLDLFGKGGLFGLLCTARTPAGKETLAGWLTTPAPVGEALARQEAVRELETRPELREQLWQSGGQIESEVAEDRLSAWIEAPSRAVSSPARLLAAGLALAGLPAVWFLSQGRPLPALLIFSVQAIFARRHRALVEEVSRRAYRRANELVAIQSLVGVLEATQFTSPTLVSLRAELAVGELPSRRRLGGLIRWVEWLESRRNAVYLVLTAPFLWGTQLAMAIEAWRARHGAVVARWVRAVSRVEAMASLATHAFEHPTHVYPELVADTTGPLFEATALAHPLLPRGTRVANDLRLGSGTQMLLVTGSNMSGKSTLLRTVGVNAVLAQAGAPICGQGLRMSRLEIGATLRTLDSLQGGTSRFFAEIKRLKDIVAMAERSPFTLFLLDEILHGTNSQDRQKGGEAVLRALLDRGAIGLCTSHDLALARLADELHPRARNAHFQDRIEGDRLIFDYRLREGIVTRSNALDLMRLIGLPV